MFARNSFKNTIRVTNSLNPDQAQHFFGPGLGLNCLLRSSADETSKQKVNKRQLTVSRHKIMYYPIKVPMKTIYEP